MLDFNLSNDQARRVVAIVLEWHEESIIDEFSARYR